MDSREPYLVYVVTPILFCFIFRAQFASVDEVHKEEIRREKRRYVFPMLVMKMRFVMASDME